MTAGLWRLDKIAIRHSASPPAPGRGSHVAFPFGPEPRAAGPRVAGAAGAAVAAPPGRAARMSVPGAPASAARHACHLPYAASPWSLSLLLFASPAVSLLDNFH